ncbi:Apolipophorins [Sergentomyia squamirostris]
MARLGILVIATLVCSLGPTVDAAAIKGKCNLDCSAGGSRLKLQPGHVYSYNVESTVHVLLSGGNGQETKVKYEAEAKVFAVDKCNLAVTVPKITLYGADDKKFTPAELATDLNKPLKFAIGSGEVCSHEVDSKFSVNIKRAVASVFVNSGKNGDVTDIDVFGTCPTVVSVSQSGGLTIINRARNLNSCSFRESLGQALSGSVFNEASGIKSAPSLNGDYSSEVRLKNGLVDYAYVSEEYLFIPFSTASAGAMSKVATKLSLIGTTKGSAKDIDQAVVQRSIAFESPREASSTSNQRLRELVKELVDSIADGVSPVASSKFVDLIRMLRYTSKNDIKTTYQTIVSKSLHDKSDLARRIYLDALFRTATGDSVEAIIDLIHGRTLSVNEQRLAMLSMNLVTGLDKDSIQSFPKLAPNSPNILPEALLATGTLVRKYCDQFTCSDEQLDKVFDRFAGHLHGCIAKKKKEGDSIVAALKGAKNAHGYLGRKLTDHILACATKKEAKLRIRVAAIEALQGASCDKKINGGLLSIFDDFTQDSELRIEAYLALVQCPTTELADHLQKVLNSEKIQQVGAFVTSHLASLRASTDPARQRARDVLGNIKAPKRFPFDLRRFSHSQELSYAIDSFGLGASVDSSVIYSQSSFLPRSVKVNMTGELFGNAFNLLDLSVRQGNLDSVVERYFGPKGVFTSKTPQQVYDFFKNTFHDVTSQTEKVMRGRRDVSKGDLQAFSKKVVLTNDVTTPELDLDFGLKFLGNEMVFLSLGDDLPTTPEAMIKQMNLILKKALDGASNFQHNFEAHALFVDGELSYPTAGGLPIRLTAHSAGVLGVEASGSIDIRKLWHDPSKAPVHVKISPSANIEMVGAFLVDAYSVSAGLQVSGSVHTSTGADVKVTMLDKPCGFDVKVNLPKKKQEVFRFNHDIVFVTHERGQQTVSLPLRFSNKHYAFNGCFDQLHRYVGVVFCADYNVTIPGATGAPLFPLNGANRVALWLEVDTDYHFSVTHSDKNDNLQFIKFTFSTPGVEGSRETSLMLESATQPNVYIRATLMSPFRNVKGEAGLNNNNQEIALYAKLFDDSNENSVKLGFSKDEVKQEYTPIFEVKTNSKNYEPAMRYKVTGKIKVENLGDSKRYQLHDIRLEGTGRKLSLSGSVTQKGSSFNTDMQIHHDGDTSDVKGDLSLEPSNIHLDLKIKGKWFANILYKMNYKSNEILNHLELEYGQGSMSRRVKFLQQWRHKHTKYRLEELAFANELELSHVPVSLKLNGDYAFDSVVKYDVGLNYGQHEASSKLDVKLNEKTRGDYAVDAEASVNRKSLKLTAKRLVQENASKYSNRLTTSNGADLELNGVVSHKINAQEADIVGDARAIFASKQTPYTAKFELKLKPQGGTTDGTFAVGKTDIIVFKGKLTRKGNNQNGNLNIVVKDIVDAKAEFNTVGGNGTADVNLNVLRLSKTIKVSSVFFIEAPTYNVATEVFYDTDKSGGNRVLRVDTQNHIEDQMFKSNNEIEVLTERFVCNVEGALDGKAGDGVITSKVNVVLPTGRALSGSLKREIRPQKEGVRGTNNINLSDKQPDGKTRSLTIDSELLDAEFNRQTFHAKHNVVYKDLEGKDVTAKLDVNHRAVKDGMKAFDGDLNLSGSLFSSPIHVNVKVPEYCEKHAHFNIAANCGNHGDVKFSGHYVIGGRAKANEYDVTFVGNSKGAHAHNLEVKSSGSFLSPQVETGVYDAKWKIIAVIDGKPSEVGVAGVANEDHANVNVNLKLHEREPLAVSLTYNHEDLPDGQSEKYNVDSTVTYGSGKTIKGSGLLKRTKDRELEFHAALDTPYDKASKLKLDFKVAKANDNAVKTSVDVTINSDVYGLNSALVMSETNPSMDIVVIYPKQTVKFNVGFVKVGDKKYNGRVQIVNLLDYNVDASGEVWITSIDNFHMKVDIDAPKLQLNKFHGELKSKQQASSKGVELQASNDGKSILSGFADYTIEQNKTLTVFEAKGKVKYYEKENEAHIKFIHHTLTEAENQETGVSLIVNAQLGPKSIVGEMKFTDKNIQLKHTACEQQRQCINFDVQSTIFQADLNSFKHQIIVSIDLRKLGYSHEFGLKAETTRTGIELDHTIEMHLQAQDKPQYQYSMYVHAKRAGVVVTLPKRIIALEGVFERPDTMFGKWDLSGALFFDKKNKPHEVVRLGLDATTTEPRKGVADLTSSLRFEHPAVRPLSVKASGSIDVPKQSANINLELDVLKTPGQIIHVKSGVENSEQSKGFNVSSVFQVTSPHGLVFNLVGHAALLTQKREVSFSGQGKFASLDGFVFLFASPERAHTHVRAFDTDLFVGSAHLEKGNKINAHATLQNFKSEPFKFTAKVNGFTDASVHLTRSKLLTVDGVFALNKAATLDIKGVADNIFHAQINLDQQHFLASKYEVKSDKVKVFLQDVQATLQQDYTNARTAVQDRLMDVERQVKQQIEKVHKDLPDYTAVWRKVHDELSGILHELEQDPSIKPVIDVVARICGATGKVVSDLFQVSMQNVQKASEMVMQFYRQLQDVFSQKILPLLKEWYNKVESILHTVYVDTMNLATAALERVSKALKDHEEDFNKVAKVSSEAVGQLVRSVTELLENLHKEVVDLQKLFLDYLASLPGVKELKEKYQEIFAQYNIPEQVVSLLKEFKTVIQDTIPSQEIREFVFTVVSYIESKLKNENVNDLDYLKQTYLKGVAAIKALIQIVKNQPNDVTSTLSIAPGGIALPLPLDFLRRIPYASSVRFSPLNYLRNENLLSPKDILNSITQNGRLTFRLVPPFPFFGQLVDGGHVFTFDGRHFTFPGTCSYILTSDFLHGNFSVVATMDKGKTIAITLFDGSNSARLEAGGNVKVNDKVVDLPVHQGDLHVWRRYYTVSLLTTAGVEVLCTTDLELCHVRVSGFYRGRLRGILGNGNGEPYDDFQLPQGGFTDNYADFGNAYGVPSCAPVAASHHAHPHEGPLMEPCASLFNKEPTLRLAYLINDPSSYKEACQHAVNDAPANKKTEMACSVIKAYVSAARLDGLPVNMPDTCLTCSENRKIGSQFSLKSPQKAADVVFVVDTGMPLLLTEFTQQLATELRKEFKAFDMADVNIAVIGFEQGKRYPSHYTHGGKLDIQGKLSPSSDATAPRCEFKLKTGYEKVDEVIEMFSNATENLAKDVGLSADARAFQEAMAYPFRSKATKIIFAVRSDVLEYSKNPSKTLTSTLANMRVKKKGIQLHLLSPVSDFAISGKDIRGATAKDIVGFSAKTVISAQDAKKRANPGQTTWRKGVKYTDDLGVDLVQDADGFVFLLQNYLGGQPRFKKQFLGAVATAVADHAARHELSLDCECELEYGLHAEEQCTVSEVKLLKQVQRQQKG